MIKVSIIVPVYNSEKYLDRCLESLVNQTLSDIEIITVNDASPDSSLSILKKYHRQYPEKIVIIDLEENLRQGGARNRGLKASRGKYIGFVDADDWVNLKMFEALYELAENTKSDIVDCNYYEAHGFNEIIRGVQSNSDSQVGELDEIRRKSLILNTGMMLTKIFKRDLFFDNKIEFEENSSYDDNQIMPILLVSASKIAKISEHLYYYFILDESTTRSINNKLAYDRLTTSINMIEEFIKRDLQETYKEELIFKFIQLYYYNSILVFLLKFDPPEKKVLFEMRGYIRNNYSKYRSNHYFKESKSFWLKFVTLLNDINPSLLVFISNLIKVIFKFLPMKYFTLLKKSITK